MRRKRRERNKMVVSTDYGSPYPVKEGEGGF